MKPRYPAPRYFRLSPEALRILEEISEELGDISERAAMEVVARFVKAVKLKTGTTYSDLLLSHQLPGDQEFPHFDRRRKRASGNEGVLSRA